MKFPLAGCSVALLLSVAMLASPGGIAASEFTITTNSVVTLGSREEARKAITSEDDFIRALSDFDRAARMKSETPVSRAEFLKLIGEETLEWTESDKTKLEGAAANAAKRLQHFRIALPAKILLVKTTGREEGNAAYCRGTNTVVLSRQFVDAPAQTLGSVFIHELFHILTRNNPKLREELYALIGFKPCREIKLPAKMASRLITNPDAPRLDYSVEVTRGDRRLAVVPVLFATPERWSKKRGGEFFAYLTWKLMPFEGDGSGRRARDASREVTLLAERDVSGFTEQIGDQPGRILQAEEILAEYFVRFVEGEGPIPARVREGMSRLLK